MRKVVLTIREDICEKYGKDKTATDLLNVMAHYGTVESYETATAKDKAEFQANIDSLTSQLEAIKENDLTNDELDIVRSYRVAKNAVVAKYTAENEQLKDSLRKADEKAKEMSNKICATLAAYADAE
jgi:hypothetical protein